MKWWIEVFIAFCNTMKLVLDREEKLLKNGITLLCGNSHWKEVQLLLITLNSRIFFKPAEFTVEQNGYTIS